MYMGNPGSRISYTVFSVKAYNNLLDIRRNMKKTLAIAIVVLAVVLTSCTNKTVTHPLTSAIGKPCEVQFKRNALGSAADLPVPPTTGSINSAQVSVSGTIRAVTNKSILIDSGKKAYWIPLDAILLVVVNRT